MPVTPNRRAFLVLAAAGALAGACGAPAPAPLRIAAGEAGGFYVEFAQLLADVLRDGGVPASAMPTGGSVENLALLATGRADLGLTLADTASGALAGGADLVALGRVYENYMQLVVRAADPIGSVADLDGRPVSLGAPGSGAADFGDRLLAASGVQAVVSRRGLAAAVDALESGAADALLWSGGVPTPALAELARRLPIRLVPLDGQLPALRARHGRVYTQVTVPAGLYGATGTVATVGVANLLSVRRDLPDATAALVVRSIVAAAPRLVPASAVGTQFLDQRSLIDTGDVPLHPGAAAAYRELHG